MSFNRHILAMENNTRFFEKVLKPIKAFLSTPLDNVGWVFDAFDLDNESPIYDAPLEDLCE